MLAERPDRLLTPVKNGAIMAGVQDLETNLEFLLRPYQRALVDQWPRPTPAIMAPFFTGVNNLSGLSANIV